MNLTKQEAINNHRAMWNWIADELEKRENTYDTVWELKEKFIDINSLPEILNDCFCCQYVDTHYYKGWAFPGACKICPLIWGNEEFVGDTCFCEGLSLEENETFNCDYEKTRGPYGKLIDVLIVEKDFEKAAKLARQIANLPEKPN